MLSFPAAINVYLCTVPCDMRRSFDGLSMLAEHVIGCNPYAGHLLVFSNRRTDRVKIFHWDWNSWAISDNQSSSHCTSFGYRPAMRTATISKCDCAIPLMWATMSLREDRPLDSWPG